MHPFSSLLIRVTSALALAMAALPMTAQAQTAEVCGPSVKEQFAVAMDAIEKKFGPDEVNPDTGLPKPNPEKENEENQIYKQFAYCGQNQPLPTLAYFNGVRNCAASHNAALSGSSAYEDMACCGYDPQKREFACPVRIKQNFGFGGSPFPGSREWVLTCVFSPAFGTYVPVARGSVHLSNSVDQPSWMFAVTAQATANLFTVLPLNQATARARSILSWNAPPTNCNYKPIWGNTIEYRIRRDQ